MSYRDATPQVIAIVTRKLKPGKTFEDFKKVHLPLGEATPTDSGLGSNIDYFSVPTRVIDTISLSDPRLVITIGFTYGDPDVILKELEAKAVEEKARHERIAEVAEKIGPSLIYIVQSDNNFGGSNPPYSQGPLIEMSSEFVRALQEMIPQEIKEKT